MPKQEETVLEAKQAQREDSKRATFAKLKNKRRQEKEITVDLTDEDGVSEEVTMLFRAISLPSYDKLLNDHPPTTEQKAEGNTYNLDTFGPDLLSRVCVDPSLSLKEWKEIWTSSQWNRGEIMQLFFAAVEICNKGLDVPK